MARKRFVIEIDETLAQLLNSSGQINIVESELHEEKIELWNDKHIVAVRHGIRISVDSLTDATYICAWTEDNKKIGTLTTRGNHQGYLGIGSASLDRKYRGKGIGKAMYVALLSHLSPKWKGIASYLPDRSNRKQVPAIYRSLGGWLLTPDYAVIDR